MTLLILLGDVSLRELLVAPPLVLVLIRLLMLQAPEHLLDGVLNVLPRRGRVGLHLGRQALHSLRVQHVCLFKYELHRLRPRVVDLGLDLQEVRPFSRTRRYAHRPNQKRVLPVSPWRPIH